MSYPVGPLLATLADRILHNLDLIESKAPKWGSPDQNQPPYSDTQLLISLLGVLVFPHERAPQALGELMQSYNPLGRVLNIVYSRRGPRRIEMTDAEGEAVIVIQRDWPTFQDCCATAQPIFINILPLNKCGRFGGIRVWNRDQDNQITFVADIDFDELRALSWHVLTMMREQRADLPLRDPEDPMVEVEAQRAILRPRGSRCPA